MEDMKKKNKILELKLKNAEGSKTTAKKLMQKNEEIEELKNVLKKEEEIVRGLKMELKKMDDKKGA